MPSRPGIVVPRNTTSFCTVTLQRQLELASTQTLLENQIRWNQRQRATRLGAVDETTPASAEALDDATQ